jgi:hypothetical protein
MLASMTTQVLDLSHEIRPGMHTDPGLPGPDQGPFRISPDTAPELRFPTVGLTVSWLRTYRTGVSRHAGLMLQVIPDGGSRLDHVESPAGYHGNRGEGRSPAEVVATYGVSRSWVYELLALYRAEGEAAFDPRSRRPHRSPGATPAQTVELVLRIHKQLSDSGLDAGAETIGWHLTDHHRSTLSRATIHRPPTRPSPARK